MEVSEPRGASLSSDNIRDSRIPVVSWVRFSSLGYLFYLFFCFISCGILFIVSAINPMIKEWFTCSSCSPPDADQVIVEVKSRLKKVPVHHLSRMEEQEHYISLEVDCIRYWTSTSVQWILQPVPDVPNHFSAHLRTIPDSKLVLSREELQLHYGSNRMELPLASFIDILSQTMVHPFYLFQYFAVGLWMAQDYVLYSLVILFITGGAIYLTTSETIFNLERLHDLAGQTVQVTRIDTLTGAVVEMTDADLVPGDQIILRPNTSLPCDCVLLSGRVSVDESMLTGESVPVNKSPIDPTVFVSATAPSPSPSTDPQRDSLILSKQTGSILFSGTKILVAIAPSRVKTAPVNATSPTSKDSASPSSSRTHCIGVVYRTSFRSAKGQLISTLLNPQENFMSFFSDALYVILFMALMCSLLYLWSAMYLAGHGASSALITLKYFDALTIAVPPGLTASLTVATGIAISRLKQKGIFVSESTRVNWAGIITAACFDKTGTLTEERLHFKGVSLPKRREIFGERIPASDSPVPNDGFVELSRLNAQHEIVMSHFPPPMMELMGTCHALSLINQTPCGDPLEVELFRASGYSLTPSIQSMTLPLSLSAIDQSMNSSSSITGSRHDNSSIRTVFGCSKSLPSSREGGGPISSSTKFQILKHFEFSSEKLRSGSLVLKPNRDLAFYCKGSPEMILQLVKPESVPSTTMETLTQLSKRGYRVIACCSRLVAHEISRESEEIQRFQSLSQSELERDCQLLGFIFLSNALKEETVMTIQTLTTASIPCTMITGDHIYTAIAIATDCTIFCEGQEVNIIDEDEHSATGLQISSMLTGAIVSYSLVDFLYAIHRLREEAKSPSSSGGRGGDCTPQSCQIAVTGRGLEVVKKRYSEYLQLLLHLTQVYARMKPSDKQFIVQEMERRGEDGARGGGECSERGGGGSIHSATSSASSSSALPILSVSTVVPDSPSLSESNPSSCCEGLISDGSGKTHVLFCGDGRPPIPFAFLIPPSGANDMAALRAATVGVSLCEAETSVAAPVTSRYQTPGSVVSVIKEGRCSLVTAYVLVSFNIMYATIQLCNAIMMYRYGLLIGNNTYLVQDLFFTLFLGLAISSTPPPSSDFPLSSRPPPHRFFTKYLFLKLALQLVTFIAFQALVLHVLSSQEWYARYDPQGDPLSETIASETSVIASTGLCQLIIASVASCIDLPYRQEWWRNRYHLVAMAGQVSFVIYQLFGRESFFLTHVLEIQPLPYDFCYMLLSLLMMNVMVSGALSWIVDLLRDRGLI
jgi:predicted P-type ATPase